ncbi:MAG: hypothetical protein ACREGR_03035 [Minisyncoccia bacterium]
MTIRITGNKTPKLVGKLRFLCRKDMFPDRERDLKNAANTIMLYIESLGYHNRPDYWPGMTAYQDGARLVKELTGEDWRGE